MPYNKSVIEFYNKVSRVSNIDLITGGRYLFSGFNYVDYLAKDIIEKLGLEKNDDLIDVGCNVGIYHKYLKDKTGYILGIDAGEDIIEKAKQRNKYLNVEYMRFDILEEDYGRINRIFNKALVYSVIHFFNGLDDVKRLLDGLLSILKDDFIILLGEVRDREMYLNHQKIQHQQNKKMSLRDFKFYINKMFNSFYLRNLQTAKNSRGCALFTPEEIFSICEKSGITAQRIMQSSRHPFYNTCVDYILRKK